MMGLGGPQPVVKFIEGIGALPIPHGLYNLRGNPTAKKGGGCRPPCGVGRPLVEAPCLEIPGGDTIDGIAFQGVTCGGFSSQATKQQRPLGLRAEADILHEPVLGVTLEGVDGRDGVPSVVVPALPFHIYHPWLG